MLLLPGDPEFNRVLATPPPNWRHFAQSTPDFAFVARAGSGILEPVSIADLEDYLEGGEYDDRLEEIGEGEDELDFDF
ncbi:hypothetical protein H6F67_14075 [Microcoleus sp. FACHB-1515]|uniref:hypothetical protein n=1 Tax=Cyanophyceae TaxID=3028117 RepID=UPI001682F9B1|nr:hypothetical protein [Microcoleus sp. FACHB-1515]MBD2090979.1 hypothetical protein [Microcoleus sp. FACHB-1515]